MTWAPGTQWPASAELEAVAAAHEITLGELIEQMEVTGGQPRKPEDAMAAEPPPPPPAKPQRARKTKPAKREDKRPAWLFRGDAVTDELKSLLKRAAAEDPKETEAEVAMRGIRAAAMAKLQGTAIGGEPEPPVGRPGLPAVPDVASMVAELRAEMAADREAVAELRAALAAEQRRRQDWRLPKMMPEAVLRVINTLTGRRRGGDE